MVLVQLVVLVVGPGSIMSDADALVEAFRQLCSSTAAKTRVTVAAAAAAAEATAAEEDHAWQATAVAAAGSHTDSSSAIAEAKLHLQQEHKQHQQEQQQKQQQPQQRPRQATLSPGEAFFADTECVQLQAAEGRISAELLCPYPPGVQVLFPGECITADIIQLLQRTLQEGGVVTGNDAKLRTVLVISDS